MVVLVKSGDSMLNGGRIIRLFAGRTRSSHCCAVLYFIAFCSRSEVASDVISGSFVEPIVSHKCVKLRDPCLSRIPKTSQAAFWTVL